MCNRRMCTRTPKQWRWSESNYEPRQHLLSSRPPLQCTAHDVARKKERRKESSEAYEVDGWPAFESRPAGLPTHPHEVCRRTSSTLGARIKGFGSSQLHEIVRLLLWEPLSVNVSRVYATLNFVFTCHMVFYGIVAIFLFYFLRQKADMPAPKHRRQLTIWQVFLSSREEISQPGIEPPTSSSGFWVFVHRHPIV